MDHIIFNDSSDWFNESYALDPVGVFGEDVGELDALAQFRTLQMRLCIHGSCW